MTLPENATHLIFPWKHPTAVGLADGPPCPASFELGGAVFFVHPLAPGSAMFRTMCLTCDPPDGRVLHSQATLPAVHIQDHLETAHGLAPDAGEVRWTWFQSNPGTTSEVAFNTPTSSPPTLEAIHTLQGEVVDLERRLAQARKALQHDEVAAQFLLGDYPLRAGDHAVHDGDATTMFADGDKLGYRTMNGGWTPHLQRFDDFERLYTRAEVLAIVARARAEGGR